MQTGHRPHIWEKHSVLTNGRVKTCGGSLWASLLKLPPQDLIMYFLLKLFWSWWVDTTHPNPSTYTFYPPAHGYTPPRTAGFSFIHPHSPLSHLKKNSPLTCSAVSNSFQFLPDLPDAGDPVGRDDWLWQWGGRGWIWGWNSATVWLLRRFHCQEVSTEKSKK